MNKNNSEPFAASLVQSEESCSMGGICLVNDVTVNIKLEIEIEPEPEEEVRPKKRQRYVNNRPEPSKVY